MLFCHVDFGELRLKKETRRSLSNKNKLPADDPKTYPPHPSSTMRWPPWSSSPAKDDSDKKSAGGSWNEALELTKWSRYAEPKTLIPTLLLTSTVLLSVRVYRAYLRRIPEATYILPGFFRKRSIFGQVTRVGDGDNFHLYHTPGGRLAGWGWVPGRSVPTKQTDLRGRTVGPCRLLLSGVVTSSHVGIDSC
jgi:hypothetical protein